NKYTLTFNGSVDITVEQNGKTLSPVGGVYTVEALAEVTIKNESDEVLEWFDDNGNNLGSGKTYKYTPTGDHIIYLDPKFVMAGLNSIEVDGKALEGARKRYAPPSFLYGA
ncbi:MAG: hypothetical protein J6R23_02405, partial [Spirochaetales bacterium]|nr:hypothetical protein [Spirochaetales bacterium]